MERLSVTPVSFSLRRGNCVLKCMHVHARARMCVSVSLCLSLCVCVFNSFNSFIHSFIHIHIHIIHIIIISVFNGPGHIEKLVSKVFILNGLFCFYSWTNIDVVVVVVNVIVIVIVIVIVVARH